MLIEPNCHKRDCRHYIGVKNDGVGDESTERVYCSAFPDRIPDKIAYGNDLHDEVKEGQVGNFVFSKV